MIGRVGALKSWSNTSDKAARTKPARDGFLRKFEIEVDPDRILPEKERTERALYARRSHMINLARKSAQVRRAATQARAGKGQSDVQPGEEDDGCVSTGIVRIRGGNRAGQGSAPGEQAAG